MSIYESLALTITFAMFIVSLISLINNMSKK